MHKQAALIAVVLACLTAAARADVPPSPEPLGKTASRSAEAPLVLAPGAKDDPQMYLRLPRSLWEQWRADASVGGDTPRYAFASSRGATLVAGLALTVSLSLAGLWMVRGGRRRLLGTTTLAVAMLVLLGVSGCPPKWPDDSIRTYNERLAPPVAKADGSLKGEALLQIEDRRSSIQVVVPPDELATFARSQSEK